MHGRYLLLIDLKKTFQCFGDSFRFFYTLSHNSSSMYYISWRCKPSIENKVSNERNAIANTIYINSIVKFSAKPIHS